MSSENIVKKDLTLKAGIHNKFELELRDAETGELKQKAVAYNVILDNFWAVLFGGSTMTAPWHHIQYGSGTGTPSSSDTQLFHYEGDAACTTVGYDDSHYIEGWNSVTFSITLDTQTAVGVTISEVGFAQIYSPYLTTHALLEDMSGNPTTITKTDTEILTIYATLYIHWNVAGVNGVKYIPAGHWLGEVTFSYSSTYYYIVKGYGSSLRQTSISFASSGNVIGDPVTKTWTFPTKRIDQSKGNYFGCTNVMIQSTAWDTSSQMFQIDLKDAYQIVGESVGIGDGTTTTYDLKFDLPYDVLIYVDGVLQNSGYTVYRACHYQDVSYFERLDLQSTDQIHIPTTIDKADCIFYNPYQRVIKITKVKSNYNNDNYCSVYASDDMVSWTLIASNQNFVPVPEQYQNSKYWKVITTGVQGAYGLQFTLETPQHAIVFDNPPAQGAVIIADYKTPFLPKDENNVYDIGMTIQLGSYSNN